MIHISAASSRPLAMPEIAPISMPTNTATNIAATPTASDILPPYISRASRSWPSASVPQGCAQDGPCSMAEKSIASIGTRQISGPTRTPNTISAEHDQARPPPADACGSAATPRASATAAPRRAAPRQPPGQRPQRRAMRGSSQTYSRSAIRLSKHDEAGVHEGDGHDDRRVVGQDRRDQQRSDAGNAEDLFRDDGAAEDDAAVARRPASPPGSARCAPRGESAPGGCRCPSTRAVVT